MSRVVVYVSGGLVQEVLTDCPKVEVVVVDHDETEDDSAMVAGYTYPWRVNAQVVAEQFGRAGQLP